MFIFYLISLALSAPNNLKINLILFDKKARSFFPFSLFQSNQIPYQLKYNQSKSLENSPWPFPGFAQNASSAAGEKGMPGKEKRPVIWF